MQKISRAFQQVFDEIAHVNFNLFKLFGFYAAVIGTYAKV